MLFFVENDICLGDDYLIFAFICVKKGISFFLLETALFAVKVAHVSSQ